MKTCSTCCHLYDSVCFALSLLHNQTRQQASPLTLEVNASNIAYCADGNGYQADFIIAQPKVFGCGLHQQKE